jgi:putative hydrolase of the HAD superfamily
MNRLPEMILFDYGHTLIYEPKWSARRGMEALLARATRNPDGVRVDDIMPRYHEIFGGCVGSVRRQGFDVHGADALRTVCESMGVEFDRSELDIEEAFWNGTADAAIMPDADKMIECINSLGIRSGVISNLTWSQQALSRRINRLLPDNRFEFIMSSREYIIRKPNTILFDIALRKAKLPADKVWFCGDNPTFDVLGAHNAGIFPVWYDNDIERGYRDYSGDIVPDFEHFYIKEWSEMIEELGSPAGRK